MPQDEHRSRTLRVATYNVHRCRGMDARTVPQRIASVLAPLDADADRAAGSAGRQPAAAGPGRRARRGARHGLGDGADPPPARRALRQRRAVAAADPPARRPRSVVEDLRAARRAAGRPGARRRAQPASLQRAPRHGAARAPLPGRSTRAPDPRSAHPRAEGRARRLQRVGPRPGHRHPVVAAAQRRPEPGTSSAGAPIPGFSRSSTSITSTTRDGSRCGTSSWSARGRR